MIDIHDNRESSIISQYACPFAHDRLRYTLLLTLAKKDTHGEHLVRLQEVHGSHKLELVVLSLDGGPNTAHSLCSP